MTDEKALRQMRERIEKMAALLEKAENLARIATDSAKTALDQRDDARAQLAKVQAEAGQLRGALEAVKRCGQNCNCDGYGGPCGCGERCADIADDALSTTAGRGWVSTERLKELLGAAWDEGTTGARGRNEAVDALLKEAQ